MTFKVGDTGRTNHAPEPFWHRMEQACGTVRHTLFLNGKRTPYFIDVARFKAHRSYGERIGLWAAGAGRKTEAGWRGAGFMGGFKTIEQAKHRAEQSALDLLPPDRSE